MHQNVHWYTHTHTYMCVYFSLEIDNDSAEIQSRFFICFTVFLLVLHSNWDANGEECLDNGGTWHVCMWSMFLERHVKHLHQNVQGIV